MLFPFLLVAGPHLNAVVLQGSARFAQGFRNSARQVPVTGEQMILANQGQNRAQANAQARLLYFELLFSGQLLFFPLSSLSSDSSTSCTSS